MAAIIQDKTTNRVILPLYCLPSLEVIAKPTAMADSLKFLPKLTHRKQRDQVKSWRQKGQKQSASLDFND